MSRRRGINSLQYKLVTVLDTGLNPTTLGTMQLYLSTLSSNVLFEDAAGTTPATDDSDPIGQWKDTTTNGNNATQSTTASKPTLALATSGIVFDGTDDSLVWDSEVASATWHIFMVVSLAAKVNEVLLGRVGSSVPFLRINSTTVIDYRDDASTLQTITYTDGDLPTATKLILEIQYQASGVEVFVNGTSIGSNTTGIGALTLGNIGSRAALDYASMTVYALLPYTTLLSAGNRTKLLSYLTNRHGL